MKKLLTNVFTIAVLAGVGTAVGFAVAFTRPAEAQVQYKDRDVTVLVKESKGLPPVLQRIIKCESGGSQLKNGQVLIAINTNGTYDQGIAQINSIHNADAAKRGFNLATEEGNVGYAIYLYENNGTGDWSSSQKCWR